MIKNSSLNYLQYLFFLIFFIIGINVCGDYLVTPDEPLHRVNGFISLKYIIEIFSLKFTDLEILNSIPNLYSDWRKTYGVAFDLPLAFIELIFNLNIQDSFLLRHYLTFTLFFISSFYFYNLIEKIFHNKYLALLGTLILISTPRIFSHSFYNSKDIIFLSLLIIAVYYALKLINRFSFKTLFLFCFFGALSANIRIIGIYLPLLTIIFYFFLDNKYKSINNFKFITYALFGYFIFLYISWPFLWTNPIENFLTILKQSTSYPNHWNFKILYLGNYLNPENLPWHYFFIWFAITTPIIFFILVIYGIFNFLQKYLTFFLKINFNKKIMIWENLDQMKILFVFLCFFIPIFFVITLNSTLYNGWRHLYFLYPFLVIISLYGLNNFLKKSSQSLKILVLGVVFAQIISNFFFIYKSHPVQNIYFNAVSKKFITNNFPIDYWGLGNKKTVDYLLTKKNHFNISNSSFIPLNNLKYSKRNDLSYTDRIEFLGTQKKYKNSSDFIFTNYYYNRDPKNVEKFKIPKTYKSYYKLKIGGIIVNEVFVK